MSLTEQQFAVTHKIRQIQTPPFLDSLLTNTSSVKIYYLQKKIASPYIFVKTWRG